jgi:hypothetical protein
MERSFHGGHSLMHGASMSMRKKPRASIWARLRGRLARSGWGRIKRAMILSGRRSDAPRQPSETTHATAAAEKAPRRREFRRGRSSMRLLEGRGQIDTKVDAANWLPSPRILFEHQLRSVQTLAPDGMAISVAVAAIAPICVDQFQHSADAANKLTR